MTSIFEEEDLSIIWKHDRSSVKVSNSDKSIDYTIKKCFKIYRPEKTCTEIIMIEGSRFSGNMRRPMAIFFVPWREKENRWSIGIPLREYTFNEIFNNTIEEVENPKPISE